MSGRTPAKERSRGTEPDTRRLDDGEQLEAILNNIADAVITIGEDGIIRSFNAAAERVFGYAKPEVIGQPVGMLIPEPHRTNHLEHLSRYLKTGESRFIGKGPREVEGVRKDGSRVPLELAITEVSGKDRRIFIGAARDISDRKRTEDQLRQAQKMEAVGQLTGGVAHDFNNLLAVIVGSLDFAADQLGDRAALEALLDTAREAARQGAELTERLLSFSSRQTLEPVLLRPDTVIAELEPLIRRTLPETIDLELVLRAEPWQCRLDRGAFDSGLLNLVINARDAMPAGGRLTIRSGKADFGDDHPAEVNGLSAGMYVSVTVEDNGVGIPSAQLDRVFEPFFTTKEPGRGTGLGLSMVFGFARQSGGAVTISSAPGDGTTVRMYLPRSLGVAGSINHPQVAADRVQKGKRGSVVIAEDNALLRDLLLAMVSNLGYDAAAFESGPEVLRHLDSGGSIDVLLTDVVLPGGLSGKGLADTLSERGSKARVVFMSGYSSATVTDWEEIVRNGGLLKKPFSRAQLADALRLAMG